MRLRRLLPLTLLPALVLLGCGTDDVGAGESAAASASEPTSSGAASTVIVVDVRTPEEYEMGHLSGALNLDLEGGELEAALGDLDPSATYIVYCRSGNRSAVATSLMQAQGITRIQDLGPLENAAAITGLDVVTGSAP